MRGDNIGNLGAHSGNYSMVQKGVEIMSSIYRDAGRALPRALPC